MITESQSTQSRPDSSMQDTLARVTSGPGVYVMKDAEDRVIYVGKARNLKKRLASYFTRSRTGPLHPDIKTGILVKKISNFETIITNTEKEKGKITKIVVVPKGVGEVPANKFEYNPQPSILKNDVIEETSLVDPGIRRRIEVGTEQPSRQESVKFEYNPQPSIQKKK